MESATTLASQIAADVHLCENGPWMIPCSVKLPTGRESGSALVIGVGGSTLRLTHVTVHAGSAQRHSSSVDIMSTEIPPAVRAGNLFEWCAAQLVPHLEAHYRAASLLAVSWSFPLVNGRIQTMGKTFSERYVGCDLLETFNAELPPAFRIVSATHDGLASLVAGVHTFPACVMALTLGTGVNVTAVGPRNELVNTEISMLGRADTTPHITLPTQPWDIDGAPAAFQPFETQVGGLWLGPMASRALGEATTTRELWRILAEPQHKHYKTVDAIVSRAAWLVAASLYGLALAFDTARLVAPGAPQQVAYTGGVVFEPEFRSRLDAAMAGLAAHFGLQMQLVPERQGSEVGAAIAALAALPTLSSESSATSSFSTASLNAASVNAV